jgi:hypothetical protein
MPIAAAAIGAGSNLLQGYFARQDEKNARKMAEGEKRNALAFLQQASSQDALAQALQEAQLKSGYKKQLQAFGGARTAIGLGGDTARRDVLNQGERMQADKTQQLISQGLIGTSAGTGQASDLAGQTTQQLANIDQQLAQAYADLGLAQGQTEASQSEQLAQLLGRGQEFQRQIGLARTEFAPAGKTGGGGGFDWKKAGLSTVLGLGPIGGLF